MTKKSSIFNIRNKGFTLIELLVVISITGVLGSTIYAPFNEARKKGRDGKRVSEISSIQKSLELYADSHNGCYPNVKKRLFFTNPQESSLVLEDNNNNFNYKYINKALYDKILYAGADVDTVFRSSLSEYIYAWSTASPYMYLPSSNDISSCRSIILDDGTIRYLYTSYQLMVELETKSIALISDADKNLYDSSIPDTVLTNGIRMDNPLFEACTSFRPRLWNCVYDVSN